MTLPSRTLRAVIPRQRANALPSRMLPTELAIATGRCDSSGGPAGASNCLLRMDCAFMASGGCCWWVDVYSVGRWACDSLTAIPSITPLRQRFATALQQGWHFTAPGSGRLGSLRGRYAPQKSGIRNPFLICLVAGFHALVRATTSLRHPCLQERSG